MEEGMSFFEIVFALRVYSHSFFQCIFALFFNVFLHSQVPSMNYPRIAEAALQSGPKSLQRYASTAAYVHLFKIQFLLTKQC